MASAGTRHTGGTQTYVQAKYSYVKNTSVGAMAGWRSEDLPESFFYPENLWAGTHMVRLSGKRVYPLSHLVYPTHILAGCLLLLKCFVYTDSFISATIS